MIVVFSVVEIVQKLLEQILQFIFQSLNIQQAAFVSRVITLMQKWLRQFKALLILNSFMGGKQDQQRQDLLLM